MQEHQLKQKAEQFQETSGVQWSEEKYKQMEALLQGYWLQDVWSPHENPLRDKSKDYTGVGSCLRFTQCPLQIKTEIKYACYERAKNQEWSMTSLHFNASKLNRICEWLGEKHLQSNSLVDRPLSEWLLSLRTYLIEIDKYYGNKKVRGVNKRGETIAHNAQDDCIYKFTQLYKLVFNFYNDGNEYEKDIWDLRKLGFTDEYVSSSHQHLLNFTELKRSWLYLAAKHYIKYKLPLVSPSTCSHKLLSIRKFYEFLSESHPNIRPSEINRSLIIEYLGYVAALNIGSHYRHRVLADLRDFLELCFREKWVNVTGNQLIYDDDLPKYKRTYNADYIPEEVIQQIQASLDELKNPMHKRMFLVLIECGMRISELCHLCFNCLRQDSKGDFFLQYYQYKLKKDITIPIARLTVKVIQEQQDDVREQRGEDCPFLFPSSKYVAKDKATSYRPFRNALKELIYEKDIKDINGKLWEFHSHQCRHTVGTRMINNGVPQHIIQRYLGHESPTMTQVYAHIHDKTLKREIAKYHDGRVVNIVGEVVESEYPELDVNLDLQWMKKNILAQALPNGTCARPVVKGQCPHANACFTCGDFRTTIEFLDQHKEQLSQTEKILEKANANGWQRQVEMNEQVKQSLTNIINALEADNE